ncbi:hypothetical protein P3T36_002483 [Kitasatospora sp. MAP12-15]|uniref:DUF4097 family beta strand repeat-containing protein n=1 Tax=unclassified Kitasatospora TaxID=2633591 RepID=UPI0024735698|nr:DUF4097 family beta strand repeat-containing protein [Kitasatospora sp. MAP12-44]MDH6112764.1 hypothetical protein [Kitasatospora sp. MAP12-44]
MTQWTISTADKIVIEEPVTDLHVRIVGGAVNVVAAEGPARLEVTELEGEPLQVTLAEGVLTVSYANLDWNDFGDKLKSVESVKHFLSGLRRKRRAVVSLTVPASTTVKVGTVTAEATVSGIHGGTSVYGVEGDTTLVELDGRTEAKTVSGNIDAQAVAGELRVNTVNGELTVVSGTAATLRAKSISGGVTLDLNGTTPADVKITTVNGDVVVRLPQPADTTVEAGSTNGRFSSAFDELTLGGTWGSKKLSGKLGEGTGRLQVTTVSGAISLLSRPEPQDEGPRLVKELPATPADAVTPEGDQA